MSRYLDASVLVPLVVDEPSTPAVSSWLGTDDQQWHVSWLAMVEVNSAISRRRRMRELSDPEGELALSQFDEWVFGNALMIDNEPGDFVTAAHLVRRPLPKLLVADAVHVATCLRSGLTLITEDQDLFDMARHYGVAAIRPSLPSS